MKIRVESNLFTRSGFLHRQLFFFNCCRLGESLIFGIVKFWFQFFKKRRGGYFVHFAGQIKSRVFSHCSRKIDPICREACADCSNKTGPPKRNCSKVAFQYLAADQICSVHVHSVDIGVTKVRPPKYCVTEYAIFQTTVRKVHIFDCGVARDEETLQLWSEFRAFLNFFTTQDAVAQIIKQADGVLHICANRRPCWCSGDKALQCRLPISMERLLLARCVAQKPTEQALDDYVEFCRLLFCNFGQCVQASLANRHILAVQHLTGFLKPIKKIAALFLPLLGIRIAQPYHRSSYPDQPECQQAIISDNCAGRFISKKCGSAVEYGDGMDTNDNSSTDKNASAQHQDLRSIVHLSYPASRLKPDSVYHTGCTVASAQA